MWLESDKMGFFQKVGAFFSLPAASAAGMRSSYKFKKSNPFPQTLNKIKVTLNLS
jgi:hypothetical protein